MRRKQNEEPVRMPAKHTYCGGCENGWREGKGGWYPCQCNRVSIEMLRKLDEDRPAVSIEEVARTMEINRMATQDFSPVFARFRSEIRQTLKKADDGAMEKKKQYWATNRLARKLNDVSRWGVTDWEKFNLSHEDPFRELEELEGPDDVARAFRASLPPEDMLR